MPLGPGQLGASACQVEWCPASIAYDGVGVDCVQNATSAIRRLPLWGLYPNWLLELASKSLHRNPLRKRLHQWLSSGAGVRDIEFVHYVLMHGAPVAPQHAWPAAVPIQPNHSSALTTDARTSVQQQLVDEIDTGILLKFKEKRSSAFQPFGLLSHVHPMGAVEKLDGTSRVGWRIVHDLSLIHI